MSVWVYPVMGAFLGWSMQYVWYLILFAPMQKPGKSLISFEGLVSRKLSLLSKSSPNWLGWLDLHLAELGTTLSQPERVEHMIPFIETKINTFLTEGLPKAMPVLSMFIGDSTVSKIREVFMAELRSLLPELIRNQFNSADLSSEVTTWLKQKFEDDMLRWQIISMIRMEFRPAFRMAQLLGLLSGCMAGLLGLLPYFMHR